MLVTTLWLALAIGQPPKPEPIPPPAPPTIGQLIDALTAVRAKKASLEKEEAAALDALRARAKELADQLAALGVLIDPPKPPPPPKPPDPPAPADAFKTELLALLKPVEAGQPQNAAALAGLYRQAAKLANDPDFTTCADLIATIQKAGIGLLPVDALRPFRNRVLKELQGVCLADAPLTNEIRANVASIYGRAAAALEESSK